MASSGKRGGSIRAQTDNQHAVAGSHGPKSDPVGKKTPHRKAHGGVQKPMTPDRISRLRSNPGTRAALDAKFLTPEQRNARAMNARLNAPVIPGSALTNRDLAHQRDAAVQVQYGPQDQALNAQTASQTQLGQDTQNWYDQYLGDLRQHAANIQANNTAANTALSGLTANVGKLTSDVQGAGQGVQQDAQNATAVRQALLGSFGAQQVATGKSSSDYADTLAHVVGPGQKLQARAQSGRNLAAISDKKTALAGEKGAFATKFVGDTIAGEQKNVLTQQALTGKTAAQQSTDNYRKSQLDLKRGIDPVTGKKLPAKPKSATEKKTQAELDYFDKHGYWPPTGPPKPGKGKPKGKGPDWLTPSEMGAGLSQLVTLKSLAAKAKAGQPFTAGHKPQPKVDRRGAGVKIQQNVSGLKDPILVTAALDAVYARYLSASTVHKLIQAGYKPSRVAQALGVPTAGQGGGAGRVVADTVNRTNRTVRRVL